MLLMPLKGTACVCFKKYIWGHLLSTYIRKEVGRSTISARHAYKGVGGGADTFKYARKEKVHSCMYSEILSYAR